jgi:hypothetical protein
MVDKKGFLLSFAKKQPMKLILTTCILALNTLAFGQLTLEGNLEFDSQGDETVQAVYPIGKRGFLAYARINDEETDRYTLTLFSTKLEKGTSLEFDLNIRTKDHGLLVNADSSEFTFIRSSRSEWLIKTFHVDGESFTEKVHKKTEGSFVPLTFLLLKNKIIMTGLIHRRPRIMMMDMETGQQDVLEVPEMSATGSVESLSIDETNEHAVIFFRKGKDQKLSSMNLIFLDATGAFSAPYILEKNSDFSIIDGSVTWLNETSFLLGGTYGLGHTSNKATGFYVSKWENNVQQFITYHSFSDFKGFVSYLPARQQKKIEKKSKKDDATDVVENMVVLHPVFVTGSGFRMIGEVYYPTYRKEYRTSVDANGRITTRAVDVFDGFEYTHAAVLDLDDAGNKVSDCCFPFALGTKPYKAVKYLRVFDDSKGEMNMMYAGSYNLNQVSITDGEATTNTVGNFVENIKTEGRTTNFTRCVYWYDNVYLAYSVQKIDADEDASKKEKKNRPTVFIVNKLSYKE